jgi:hypothetical protein
LCFILEWLLAEVHPLTPLFAVPCIAQAIMSTPGLVEAMRNILATTESARTKEVAKGCLWTLGESFG